ncbi:hypothetical protein QBC37DRAFT_475544 [Rhypophila decipiens]|uniref:Uncharacterized protein n=1 Tax=Rhypophila decipiens TaxID=261697 RepID=A0AAN6Y4X6_9PEZI|nr:hypothetical protein QBC37DRAFT_475544 [Rhypophila decipiens]
MAYLITARTAFMSDLQNPTINLLLALQSLRASRLLRSSGSGKNLLNSDDFDLDRIKPLLNAALADHLDDSLIWSRVCNAHVDGVLKEELGPMYVGLRNFHEAFFGGVAGFETASKAVLKKCMEGNNPQFRIEEG